MLLRDSIFSQCYCKEFLVEIYLEYRYLLVIIADVDSMLFLLYCSAAITGTAIATISNADRTIPAIIWRVGGQMIFAAAARRRL